METGDTRSDETTPAFEGYDVVIVEDNKDVIRLLKVAFLNDPEVMVHVFLGPFAALEWLHVLQYDVDAVITDIVMAQMTGRKLTEDIREYEKVMRTRPDEIQIFWYTGYDLDLDNPDSEYTKTFESARVRKVFTKATHNPIAVIKEVVEILKQGN